MNESYIACGFRCYCKKQIKKNLKIKQPSLPFDSGFFSPNSIINFLEKDEVDINIKNTTPCTKTEDFYHNDILGINFESSTYNKINNFIKKNGYSNNYLDNTRGYYTLCKDYGFILAHYNWHASSRPRLNKGVVDPEENLKKINPILTRRKQRLLDLINTSDKINLCFYEDQNFEFMRIDQLSYSLSSDLNLLKSYFQDRFKNKSFEILLL